MNKKDEGITIEGIRLFTKQKEIAQNIINSKSKYCLLNASRQSGKTTLLSQLILYWAINEEGSKILYVSPTYKLCHQEYRKMVDWLSNTGIVTENNKSELLIKLNNGSEIQYRSATNYDNIRGGSYDYCCIDEFSYIDPNAWNSVIRQTLNVRGKKAVLVSTPRGKNLFWELCERGKKESETNYTYDFLHYSDNGYYDLDEVLDAKRTLPENIYKQEYEGLFLDDGGSVFRNIEQICILPQYSTEGSKFYAGLDLGRVQDYTVLTILNEHGEVVEHYRKNLVDWRFIIKDVIDLLKKYKPYCYIETNSIGDRIYEEIYQEYKYIEPFVTTSNSKNEMIENLIMGFTDKKLKLPNKKLNPDLYSELNTFSFKYSPQQHKIQYGCYLSGFHDDTVISLGLSYKSLTDRKNKGKLNYSFIL